MTLVMAVTADEYELPLAVLDKQCDMARLLGLSQGALSHAISRCTIMRKNPFNVRMRVVRINIDEED